MLYAQTRQAPGGVNAQAIAAIENALLDVKAKALGVRVCELFGGPVRERLPLYWSHCGTYRVTYPELCGVPPVASLDDVTALGARCGRRGMGRSSPTSCASTAGRPPCTCRASCAAARGRRSTSTAA
jgi:L-alanine-DL-glutamate epimerase-like enolase superfamily enzyme